MSEGARHYDQNNLGENIFAAQGTQNIYLQSLEDHFRSGLEALKNRLYPKAVERFENYLSTATSAPAVAHNQVPGQRQDSDSEFSAVSSLSEMTSLSRQEVETRMARAHIYAVLGLLNGTAPSYHPPEVIRRIDLHLENARKVARGQAVFAQASVVWAIIKDDWYDYQGMHAPDPQASELRRSIADLDREDLGTLLEHLAPAQGETWKQLVRQASESGFAVDATVDEETRRPVSPGRAEAVRKYFIRTPDPVSPAAHIIAFAGAGLLILLGIASGSAIAFCLLAALAIWPVRWGTKRVRVYLQYRKDLTQAEPKPSDDQMDQWLREDVEYITRRAARRLRLNARLQRDGGDLVVPEQIVVGIPEPNEPGAGKIRVRLGEDRQLRADHYTVLILFLTDKMVSTYRCVTNFVTSNLILDETREYHYTDIVGVSSSSIPMNGPIQNLVDVVSGTATDISLAHQFSLSIVSGESLRVVTGFGGRFEQAGGTVVWRGNEHALKIIQTMVRSRHAR
jgi:hypothetical protein